MALSPLPFQDPLGDVPFLNLRVELNNPIDGVAAVFRHFLPNGVAGDEERDVKLNIVELSGGLINRLFRVSHHHQSTDGPYAAALVRLHKTELPEVFDRDRELRIIRFLASHGLFGQIYGRFENGICYRYQNGEPLTVDQVAQPDIAIVIARTLAHVHAVSRPLVVSEAERTGDCIRRWFNLICSPDFKCLDPFANQRVKEAFPNLNSIREEFEVVWSECQAMMPADHPLVVCHNDLIPANMILSDSSSSEPDIRIIDYEFAGIGHQAQEIGYFMSEFVGMDIGEDRYPDLQFQLNFITEYLKSWYSFTQKGERAVNDDEVWNMYVRATKYSQLRHFACLAGTIAIASRDASYSNNVESLGGHDAIWYVLQNWSWYQRKKEQLQRLDLKPE
ncbi:putative Ethanolamine kinase 1 [Hypsibius exemplaris]|uniref:ethanolamine kinase n=1 Tax=Hypsibius exemplaris TaxID=2072580 RepID=A0A1W0XFH4_HYPEX|nr:putative Ethanolamine kinase 1 [Hypsibius exemplaris]